MRDAQEAADDFCLTARSDNRIGNISCAIVTTWPSHAGDDGPSWCYLRHHETVDDAAHPSPCHTLFLDETDRQHCHKSFRVLTQICHQRPLGWQRLEQLERWRDMIKIFRWFHPKQIARYVKTFHQGVFFIDGQGPFRFEGGVVCYEPHHGHGSLQSVAEINRQLRDLRQFRP